MGIGDWHFLKNKYNNIKNIIKLLIINILLNSLYYYLN